MIFSGFIIPGLLPCNEGIDLFNPFSSVFMDAHKPVCVVCVVIYPLWEKKILFPNWKAQTAALHASGGMSIDKLNNGIYPHVSETTIIYI